jgi:hypothetical protein
VAPLFIEASGSDQYTTVVAGAGLIHHYFLLNFSYSRIIKLK